MDFLVVVEAKHHTHPIKRELVQILHGKAVSVGAQKAVLIATASLQQVAINDAKTHGIALVLVTEARFTLETRDAEERTTPSREEADALGLPALWLVSALDLTGTGSGVRIIACLWIGPISSAKLCSASNPRVS